MSQGIINLTKHRKVCELSNIVHEMHGLSLNGHLRTQPKFKTKHGDNFMIRQ